MTIIINDTFYTSKNKIKIWTINIIKIGNNIMYNM